MTDGRFSERLTRTMFSSWWGYVLFRQQDKLDEVVHTLQLPGDVM